MFEEVWRAYEKNELSHSAAHHLMAVHELRQKHGYARVSDIAQHLKITKGSVSSAMKHLKEREYVQEDHNRFLELTEKGLKVVQETETTRLVVQKFLTDALGMTAWFDPGGMTKELLLGASAVGPEALIRFYVLHVIVLPLGLVGLLGLHFWRIRKDGGLARPGAAPTHAGKGAATADAAPTAAAMVPSKTYGLMAVVRDRRPATDLDPADTVPSWPYLFRAELLLLIGCILVCLLLGMAFDAPLKELANPSVPENPAKAPWYFLGLQELVSYSAFIGGVFLPAVVVIGLSLIPYVDREKFEPGVWFSSALGKKVAWHSLIFGTVVSTLAVAFPVTFGWLRNWFPNIPQLIIIFLNPGTLLTAAIVAWSIRILRKTGSTRMSAIALFTCFLAGFTILTWVATVHRGPNWDFYWTHASWPVH